MRRVTIAVATALSVLTLGGCGGGGGQINAAYDKCFEELEPEQMLAFEKGDGGESITIDLQDDDEDGIVGVMCILKELNPSDALIADIIDTTSQMGRQTQTEKGLIYRWSYHPDNGLNMTIRED